MAELVNLVTAETRIKVSSTLDKSVGKRNLTDDSPESCWTSQQGTPQYIQLSFESPVIPKKLLLTFQGGFVGTKCSLEVQRGSSSEGAKLRWEPWMKIYPEDVNRRQSFELEEPTVRGGVGGLRLVFEESSDFFGRITVYDLQLSGFLSSS